MIHWDTPRDVLPDTMTIDYKSSTSTSKNTLRVSDGDRGVFFVDGDEMFVPTSLKAAATVEDFFVVL